MQVAVDDQRRLQQAVHRIDAWPSRLGVDSTCNLFRFDAACRKFESPCLDVQKELEKPGGAGQPGKSARLRIHYAGQSLKKMNSQ